MLHLAALLIGTGIDLHATDLFACAALVALFINLEEHLAASQPVGHGAHGAEHAPDALVIDNAKEDADNGGDGENHDKGFPHQVEVPPYRYELDGQHGHQDGKPAQAKGRMSKEGRYLAGPADFAEKCVKKAAARAEPVAPVSALDHADGHGAGHAGQQEVPQGIIEPAAGKQHDKAEAEPWLHVLMALCLTDGSIHTSSLRTY